MRKWFHVMDSSKRNNWSSEERKQLKDVHNSLSAIMKKAQEQTKAKKARYARRGQVPLEPARSGYANAQGSYPQPGPYPDRD